MQSLPSTAKSYQQAEDKVSGLLDQISSFLNEDEPVSLPAPPQTETPDAAASNLVLFPRATTVAPEPNASLPSETVPEPESARTDQSARALSPLHAPLTPATEAELEQSIAQLLEILAPEEHRKTTLTALQQLLVLLGGDVPPPNPAIAQEVTTLQTQYSDLQGQLTHLESRFDEAITLMTSVAASAQAAATSTAQQNETPLPELGDSSPQVEEDRITTPMSELTEEPESVDSEATETEESDRQGEQFGDSAPQQSEISPIRENSKDVEGISAVNETSSIEPEVVSLATVPESEPTSSHKTEEPEAIAPNGVTTIAPNGVTTIAPNAVAIVEQTPSPEPAADSSTLPVLNDSKIPDGASQPVALISSESNDLEEGTEELAENPDNAVITTPLTNSPQPQRWKHRLGVGLGLLTLLGGAWGLYRLLVHPQRTLETQLTHTFAADPQLSVYRLNADVTRNTVKLKGTLPNRQLRDHAKGIISQLAPEFELQDNTIVVDTAVAQSVAQMTETLNQMDGVDLKASFEAGEVVLSGTTMYPSGRSRLVAAFAQLPGVERVENLLKVQPVSIPTRIYFAHNETQLQTPDIAAKIAPLAQLLKNQPQLKIRIVGHGHRSESRPGTIAQSRAQTVQTLLEDQGIDRRRLQLASNTSNPPGMEKGSDRWLGRCVLFEVISPQ